MFDESKHPRADDGKFADGNGGTDSREEYIRSVNERIKWAKENGVDLPLNTDGSVDDIKLQKLYNKSAKEKKETSTNKVVKVDMDAEVQKQLSEAKTPKERQRIAYRYVMDNLSGKYATQEGRTVTISSVGADKITHKDIEVKLRASPHLADFIKAGELENIKDVEHNKFAKFAYYKVTFQLGKDTYTGMLNVGIRSDGSSTLYDLNPFNKQ